MNEVSFDFKAIGTSWNIKFACPEQKDSEQLISIIKDRIAVFEQNYSRFREDSFVGQIAQKEGVYELPADAENMLGLYRKLYDISHGKVTPLIGEVLVAAGYDKDYSLQPKSPIPTPPLWDEVMSYNTPFLTVTKPVQLDFGGLGKGYIVDIVAELFKGHDIHDYLINAGGDIAQSSVGGSTSKVGLEDPSDATKIIGIAELLNKSIAGSSGNRRKWAQYHHIIDPTNTKSPEHIAALWVVADSTMLADGLATALFFMTPEELLKEFDFEYCIVAADRTVKRSDNFPAVLY